MSSAIDHQFYNYFYNSKINVMILQNDKAILALHSKQSLTTSRILALNHLQSDERMSQMLLEELLLVIDIYVERVHV